MKNKKTIIALLSVLIAVLVIVVTVIGILMIQDSQKSKKYQEALDMAEKYTTELNYADAIIKYKEAIEIDDTRDIAYANLAVLYINTGHSEDALNILETGYQKTGSNTIKILIDTYFPNSTILVQAEIEEEKKEIEGLVLNRNLIGQMASYACQNYAADYGTPIIKTDGVEYTLTYGNLGVEFIYYNIDGEIVIDPSLKKPYDNVMPVEMRFNDLSLFFTGMKDSISYTTLQKMGLSNLKKETIEKVPYVTFQFSGCKFMIECSESGDIESVNANNIVIPISRTSAQDNKYILSGTVINATTGYGVENAEIYVRTYGSKSGKEREKIITDSNGYYQIALEANTYTIQVAKEGFVEEFFDVTVTNSSYNYYDFTISPTLQDGEVRIVLTWGATPADLDSYLDGTTDAGEEVHICYSNKYSNAAELDIDQVNGYGPEATTIHDLNGKYTFTVRDYNFTGTMSTSSAEVKVYLPGNSQPIIYNIGSGMNNEWVVFEIDHGEVRTIDRAGD